MKNKSSQLESLFAFLSSLPDRPKKFKSIIENSRESLSERFQVSKQLALTYSREDLDLALLTYRISRQQLAKNTTLVSPLIFPVLFVFLVIIVWLLHTGRIDSFFSFFLFVMLMVSFAGIIFGLNNSAKIDRIDLRDRQIKIIETALKEQFQD